MSDIVDPNTWGWGLLYHIHNKEFTSKINVIICFLHFTLCRRGFYNVGIGIDTTHPSYKEQSELLPEGWDTALPRRFRYIYNRTLYLLVISTVDDEEYIINLTRPLDTQATCSVVNVSEISQLSGLLEEIIPGYREMLERFETDLIKPLLDAEARKDVAQQTVDFPHAPFASPRSSTSTYHSAHEPLTDTRPFFPPEVGTSDLYPFGRGGGMLFEPPGLRPRLPRDPLGVTPPGARFDPIFPEGIPPFRPRFGGSPGQSGSQPNRTGSYPDADHLPPPGYDDMFS